ncbi:cellulose biosynthesis protein BcsP [Paraburkholderia caffeinilytica]|uniref:cellulose biosynthesis protein BcsP n=1 Tax=Paraburkholderia caffeinilytica TaxID=1761016 RepID=UPI0038BC6A17
MTSSSDIEKLFEHFGGDASAYQEIGRENEARSARTRWPLLVTLDLTQPTIPAIRQRREVAGETSAQNPAPAADRQDTAPKDTASVTRAKAPLFTRSHRRDIPPVVVTAQPASSRGASRFGALETKSDATSTAPAAPVATQIDAAPIVATQAAAAVAPITPAVPQPTASMPPVAVTPRADIPALTPRAPVPAPVFAPTRMQAPAPVPAWTQAPAQTHTLTWAQAPARPYSTAPAAPKPPASILGKLFAPQPEQAQQHAAASPAESAPLQSVFDRLRGTPAQTAAAPARAPRAATPAAASNSWLVNGPRRS